MPGIVTHSTDLIEHPELVSERIQRFARLVGPENVIAGTVTVDSEGATHSADRLGEVARACLRVRHSPAARCQVRTRKPACARRAASGARACVAVVGQVHGVRRERDRRSRFFDDLHDAEQQSLLDLRRNAGQSRAKR